MRTRENNNAGPVPVTLPILSVPDALGGARHPSEDLHVIGITGTNGKTTVSYLIGEVLKSAGYDPFVLGTFNSGNKDLSTPEAADILKFMRSHLDQGGTHFIMEVTSEGIDQARILGVVFDIKLLTNITQDHLDYHKTFSRYESTKLGFMSEGGAHKIYPAHFEQADINFETCLLGDYNLLNIKAAATTLRHMGVAEFHIQQVLSSCPAPSGRLESVDKGQPFLVLVDYAHTPDALQSMLGTLKKIARDREGRLLVLFGCGGNRDRGKRPKMGQIASSLADFLVITDDNPRQEDSQIIMSEIAAGIVPGYHDYVLIQDRRAAIEFLVGQAEIHDVVVLAGKGHETSQILQAGTIHFDDREEALSAISRRMKPDIRVLQ
jgi:UDP-N-acetylmuramoyl-L-alanyl-D-glutamate--2,6-diaminopimelate ligase